MGKVKRVRYRGVKGCDGNVVKVAETLRDTMQKLQAWELRFRKEAELVFVVPLYAVATPPDSDS